MKNLSAGGLAFVAENAEIKMGELLKVRINNFSVQKELSAVAIRKTVLPNEETQYSCRMLDDDADIAAYIDSKLK